MREIKLLLYNTLILRSLFRCQSIERTVEELHVRIDPKVVLFLQITYWKFCSSHYKGVVICIICCHVYIKPWYASVTKVVNNEQLQNQLFSNSRGYYWGLNGIIIKVQVFAPIRIVFYKKVYFCLLTRLPQSFMGNKQSDHKVTPIVINFGAQPTTHGS